MALPPVGTWVSFELDGAPIVGVVVGHRGQKAQVLHQLGKEIELIEARMFIAGTTDPLPKLLADKLAVVTDMARQVQEISSTVPVESMWQELPHDNTPVLSVQQLCDLAKLPENSPPYLLALRHALITDKVFFRRDNQGFSPRPLQHIERLRHEELAKVQQQQEARVALEYFSSHHRVQPPPPETHRWIERLQDLAVDRPLGAAHRETLEFFSQVAAKLYGSGEIENITAFARSLLRETQLWVSNSNPMRWKHRPAIEFDDAVTAELEQLLNAIRHDDRLDCRQMPTCTIDDAATKDRDDAISCQREPDGNYTVGIHITDVAALLPPTSVTYRAAKERATSIYLPEGTIPMLPKLLSEQAGSLNPDAERNALSVLLTVSPDGKVLASKVARTIIVSRAKFSYDEVDLALTQAILPEAMQPFNLHTLAAVAAAHEQERLKRGASTFHRPDVNVRVAATGEISIVPYDERSPGRALIAELMVITNGALAAFASKNKLPIAFRGQAALEAAEEDKDSMFPVVAPSVTRATPSPHTSLGMPSYTQATSPLRRFLDLLTQQQLSHFLTTGKTLYSEPQIAAAIEAVEPPLSKAQLLQRESKRYWLLVALQQRLGIGGETTATVLRSNLRFPLVELDELYIGFGVRSKIPLQPHNRVRIKITSIEPLDLKLQGDVVSLLG